MMRATALLSSLFLIAAAGCGDESSGSETGGLLDSGTSDDSGDDSGTTGVADLNPATGLTITKVVANQGVQVPLSVDGVWVDGNQRKAPLVGNRDTLVRAFWQLDPDWVPRDIVCRLTLVQPGGNEVVMESTVNVTENSDERDLNTTCFWGLDDELGMVEAGTTFQVSLWETGDSMGLTDHGNLSPADAPNWIGLQPGLAKMRVMLVPMTYNGVTPDVEGNRHIFEDYLYMNNPLNDIEVLVHEPVSTGSTSLNTMLTLMNGLHSQDMADGNMYYFALIDTGQAAQTVGLASLGTLWGSALWLALGSTRNTVVHEIGHCQGLGHVDCPSQGMPPYEPYPYENGKTGVTGFGVRDGSIHGGDNNYNYMSYCGSPTTTWASDWDFLRNWGRIKLFSSDEYPQGSQLNKEPVLHGILGADGVEHWWTVNEVFDPETMSGNHMITFKDGDRVETTPMGVQILSDGVGLWFTVPIPEGMEIEDVELSRTSLEQDYEVKLDMDKLWHRADAPKIGENIE